eukprot:sb/3473563/
MSETANITAVRWKCEVTVGIPVNILPGSDAGCVRSLSTMSCASIDTFKEFEKHVLHFKSNKLVVVEFIDCACNDSVVLAPWFFELPGKYPTVNFYEVDIEDNPEVKNWEKIKKTPTVKLYKAGQIVQVIEGTDKNKITAAIAKYNGTGL